MSSLQEVNRKLDVEPTPEDKGLTLTIKVKAYDNGIIQVGDSGPAQTGNEWMCTTRFIVQMMEQFSKQVALRRAIKQAEWAQSTADFSD